MEKKLRYSHQRERIMEYLCGTNEHPTAEMIYNDLREEISGLSLGTVYRNLKLLEDLGKVRKVTSYQGNERYDAICGDHIHFICEGCGTVRDMAEADQQGILNSVPLGRGYQISKVDMVITGRCPQCSEQTSNQ